MEPLKRDAAELSRYAIHISIVLSLVFSLAAIVILSKKHMTNHFWIDLAVLAGPVPIALFFKKRIVLLGVFTCVALMLLALGAAVVFGV